MDESDKGKRDPLANAERSNRYNQHSMAEFLPDRDRNDPTLGNKEEKHKGYASGIGGDGGCNSGKRHEGTLSPEVLHESRSCSILVREKGFIGYPCWTCAGGRDFQKCKEFRGMIQSPAKEVEFQFCCMDERPFSEIMKEVKNNEIE